MPMWLLLLIHLGLAAVLGVRALTRRRPASSQGAWIAVLFLLPVIGACFYLLIGERFIGARRTRRLAAAHARILGWTAEMRAQAPPAGTSLRPAAAALSRLACSWDHPPPLTGNDVEFLENAAESFDRLLGDIRGARRTCHLEFYIVEDHGRVSELLDALVAATARGVTCRLLVDALGSRRFVGSGRARSLERQGVEVRASLPFGRMRRPGARLDLRNHRKLLVVDSELAHLGSLNLVDPEFEKRRRRAPVPVDAMLRIQGPVVSVLAAGFWADWLLESDEDRAEEQLPGEPPPRQAPAGAVPVQVIATGPSDPPERLLQLLVRMVHTARERLVICTPYFVPDTVVRKALLTAARGGVDVQLIVPRRADHRFMQWVTESYFDELLAAGVQVFRYEPGFLHTKCVLVDDGIVLFGSMNLDMRSVWLNFETGVLLFGPGVGARGAALLATYERDASRLAADAWRRRPWPTRIRARVARLFAPLL